MEHVENSLRIYDDDFISRSNILEENRQLKETLAEKEKKISPPRDPSR